MLELSRAMELCARVVTCAIPALQQRIDDWALAQGYCISESHSDSEKVELNWIYEASTDAAAGNIGGDSLQ